MITKKCGKCGEVKPLTKEYFYAKLRMKDGFDGVCKACVSKRLHTKREKPQNTDEKTIPLERSVRIDMGDKTLVRFGMAFKPGSGQKHSSSSGYASALSNTRDAPGAV